MENYIYKKKRNSIDKIYSKKDDQTYNIGLSLEEKIKMGVVLPDFEFNQKKKMRFGNIVLKYTPTTPIRVVKNDGVYSDGAYYGYNTVERLFECTHNIIRDIYGFTDTGEFDVNVASETSGESISVEPRVGIVGYAFDFSINYQQMGNYGLGNLVIKPYEYFVMLKKTQDFQYDSLFLQYYDETTNTWNDIKKETQGHYINSNNEMCFYIPLKAKRKLRIGISGNSTYDAAFLSYIRNVRNKLKVFQKFEIVGILNPDSFNKYADKFINGRGVFFSENKNWYYINIDDLDNIRVKKDKWVYDNNTRYHYGLTSKSSIKNGAIYYRSRNQQNNKMKGRNFKFLNDGSYYTYCKRKNNFNWKKLKFDKDCLIEQCLTLTYNSNNYTFSHSLTKTKNKKVAYISFIGSGIIDVLYIDLLPDNIDEGFTPTVYDMNNNIVTGVIHITFDFKKLLNYSRDISSSRNKVNYIDVIKPYNGKYAYFKYNIISSNTYGFYNITKNFQRYLDYKEVPENLNHLKGYKPLPGFRKLLPPPPPSNVVSVRRLLFRQDATVNGTSYSTLNRTELLQLDKFECLKNINSESIVYNGQKFYVWRKIEDYDSTETYNNYENDNDDREHIYTPNGDDSIILTNTLDITLPFNINSEEFVTSLVITNSNIIGESYVSETLVKPCIAKIDEYADGHEILYMLNCYCQIFNRQHTESLITELGEDNRTPVDFINYTGDIVEYNGQKCFAWNRYDPSYNYFHEKILTNTLFINIPIDYSSPEFVAQVYIDNMSESNSATYFIDGVFRHIFDYGNPDSIQYDETQLYSDKLLKFVKNDVGVWVLA